MSLVDVLPTIAEVEALRKERDEWKAKWREAAIEANTMCPCEERGYQRGSLDAQWDFNRARNVEVR